MMANEKIKVSGVAIREGISRNHVKYTAKELKKFAPTLSGRPILKDHEGMTDNTIGLVERGDFLNDGQLVTYEGWIKEDGTNLIEKIKDGRIKEVSIGAIAGKVVMENEDDDFIVVKDLEAMELSTTPVPGVKGTSLNLGEGLLDLSEKGVMKMIENYETEHSHLSKNQKEVNMESENTQKSAEALMAEEKAKFEKTLAESSKALEAAESAVKELEESRRQDAIARYSEKVKAKGLESKDLSKATLETIKALTEMADELPEPAADETEDTSKDGSDDETTDDSSKDTADKEDAAEKFKVKATPKSKNVESKKFDEFKDYVLDSSESKIAFYKWY